MADSPKSFLSLCDRVWYSKLPRKVHSRCKLLGMATFWSFIYWFLGIRKKQSQLTKCLVFGAWQAWRELFCLKPCRWEQWNRSVHLNLSSKPTQPNSYSWIQFAQPLSDLQEVSVVASYIFCFKGKDFNSLGEVADQQQSWGFYECALEDLFWDWKKPNLDPHV